MADEFVSPKECADSIPQPEKLPVGLSEQYAAMMADPRTATRSEPTQGGQNFRVDTLTGAAGEELQVFYTVGKDGSTKVDPAYSFSRVEPQDIGSHQFNPDQSQLPLYQIDSYKKQHANVRTWFNQDQDGFLSMNAVIRDGHQLEQTGDVIDKNLKYRNSFRYTFDADGRVTSCASGEQVWAPMNTYSRWTPLLGMDYKWKVLWNAGE